MKRYSIFLMALIGLVLLVSCEEAGISTHIERDAALVDKWTTTGKVMVNIEKEFFADGSGILTNSTGEISYTWKTRDGILYFVLDGSPEEMISYVIADGILTETQADGTIVIYSNSTVEDDGKIPIDDKEIKEK